VQGLVLVRVDVQMPAREGCHRAMVIDVMIPLSRWVTDCPRLMTVPTRPTSPAVDASAAGPHKRVLHDRAESSADDACR
jgi:hypothetical protein